jgi:hypothetical protein
MQVFSVSALFDKRGRIIMAMAGRISAERIIQEIVTNQQLSGVILL